MNLLSPKNLKKIKISDKELFADKLEFMSEPNCELSFQNFFMWGDIYKMSFFLYKDRLFIFNALEGDVSFPIGDKMQLEELIDISNRLSKENKDFVFSQVPENYINEYDCGNRFDISTNIDFDDYIYLADDLVQLSGKKLRKKRNLIKQFKTIYPTYKVVSLADKNIQEVLEMANECLQEKGGGENLLQEYSALTKGLENFEELDLCGISIEVDNKIIAFSICSELTKNTALVHFEKTLKGYKGAAQCINFETAKILQKKYKYINREQDLGIDGLRQAKKSYQPYKMLKTYILK